MWTALRLLGRARRGDFGSSGLRVTPPDWWMAACSLVLAALVFVDPEEGGEAVSKVGAVLIATATDASLSPVEAQFAGGPLPALAAFVLAGIGGYRCARRYSKRQPRRHHHARHARLLRAAPIGPYGNVLCRTGVPARRGEGGRALWGWQRLGDAAHVGLEATHVRQPP